MTCAFVPYFFLGTVLIIFFSSSTGWRRGSPRAGLRIDTKQVVLLRVYSISNARTKCNHKPPYIVDASNTPKQYDYHPSWTFIQVDVDISW